LLPSAIGRAARGFFSVSHAGLLATLTALVSGARLKLFVRKRTCLDRSRLFTLWHGLARGVPSIGNRLCDVGRVEASAAANRVGPSPRLRAPAAQLEQCGDAVSARHAHARRREQVARRNPRPLCHWKNGGDPMRRVTALVTISTWTPGTITLG
jgi:hypothetical protein